MKQLSTQLSLILLLAFLLMLDACKKTDSTSSVLSPGDYIYQRTSDYSGLRIFTHDGEVKDQKLIDRFTNTFHFFFPSSVDTSNIKDTFHILSSSSLNYRYIGSQPNNVDALFSNFNISKIDYYYQFIGTDTLQELFTSKYDSSYYIFGKYKPYKKIKYLNTIYGIYTNVTTFKHFVSSNSGNSLVFPILRYLRINFKSLGGDSYIITPFNSFCNNVFDENSYHYLEPPISKMDTIKISKDSTVVYNRYSSADTLIIQTFNRYYSK